MTKPRSRHEFISGVAHCVRRYCSGSASPLDEERLIRLAATMARQRLYGRLRAAAYHEGVSVEQQAVSVVAHLFTPTEEGTVLAEALEEYLDADDIGLLLRFHGIVQNTAAQELFHRWRENDPSSAKLWRSLRRALRYDSRIQAFPAERPVWAALAAVHDLRSHLPPITDDSLGGLLSYQSVSERALGDLLAAVLSDVADDRSIRAAVQVESLFAELRKVISGRIDTEALLPESESAPSPDLQIAVEAAIDPARVLIDSRVARYLEAGRLSEEIAAAFGKALNDLLLDCSDGGPAVSYYEYIHAHAPQLTQGVYRSRYRTRFEYLAESVRECFYASLRKKLAGKNLPVGSDVPMTDTERGDGVS